MKIKISIENKDKIEQALKAINGNATEHTLTTFEEIVNVVSVTHHKIKALYIPYSKTSGISFVYGSGIPVANTYKYPRKTTVVTIQRGKAEWFLTNISETQLYPNQSGKRILKITPKHEKEAFKMFKLLNPYIVTKQRNKNDQKSK
jgi:hypothetical protein